MTAYRITYTDESTISELERYGKIFYDSTVMRMVWLETKVQIQVLSEINGVTGVEFHDRAINKKRKPKKLEEYTLK